MLEPPAGETVSVRSKAQTIKAVCDSLLTGDAAAAAATARSGYPFVPPQSTGRAYTESVCTAIFVRDGFIDRYSGSQLVFPGALRLLSLLLPSEFPFHRNWKMTETHMAYWELFPTVDHVVAVARGGADNDSNWVTTSMLRNSAKSNWTLEELGWQLVPPGEFRQWDGLLTWFISFLRQEPSHLANTYIRRWHRAANGRLHDAQSGSRGCLAPSPHSTPHAGPHGALPPDLKGCP